MSDSGPTLPPPTRPGTPGTPPPDDDPKKPWWKRWWAIALGALVVLIVIAGIFGGGDDDGDDGVDPSASASTATVTTVNESSATTIATESTTPSMDAPETTAAEPTVPATMAATTTAPTTTTATTTTTIPPTTTTTTTIPPTTTTMLPPQPVVYEGTGDAVQEIEFPGGDPIGTITLSYSGSSNFAVWSLDANLQQLDLLVNTIGPYEGSVLDSEGAHALEISADGQWRAETNSVLAAPPFETEMTGRGDSVLFYLGDTAVATISHAGASNFAIWSYPLDGGADLLVNEIGNYSGSVRFPGPAIVEIGADGDWSISTG